MAESSLLISESGGVQVVRLTRSSILDSSQVERITAELLTLVNGDAARMIVLDLRAVTFLSSQALGAFVTLREEARRNKSVVVFARIRPNIAEVFRITAMSKLFRFFDTTREATDFLRASNTKSLLWGVRKSMRSGAR